MAILISLLLANKETKWNFFSLFFIILFSFYNISYASNTISPYKLQSLLVSNLVNKFQFEKKNNKVVCIVGDSPVIPYIKEISTNNFLINIKTQYDSFSSCNIIFINKFFDKNIITLISKIKNLNSITVSNVNYFLDYGGDVFFEFRDEKVMFKLNLKQIKTKGIRVNRSIISISEIFYN